MKQSDFIKLSTLLAIGSSMVGCAAIHKSNTMDTERVLSAAGFKMQFANTPEKLANVQAMIQQEVLPHSKDDGTVYYAYADAEFCKCMYLGSEDSYQQYERMAEQRNIAEMNRNTAQMNENAAMDWGVWGGGWGRGGGWGPWY